MKELREDLRTLYEREAYDLKMTIQNIKKELKKDTEKSEKRIKPKS
jgi:hypothetical protein